MVSYCHSQKPHGVEAAEMMICQKGAKPKLSAAFKVVSTFLTNTRKSAPCGLTGCQDYFFTAVNVHISATPGRKT
jgi:hypothetical protein